MTMEQPRYMQILNVLSQRLETGQYPLEERLPTESELYDEFGASRCLIQLDAAQDFHCRMKLSRNAPNNGRASMFRSPLQSSL